jgi:hypothetical protein
VVAERHGVRAHVSLDIFPHVLARPVLEELDGVPLFPSRRLPSNPGQLVVKRRGGPRVFLALFLVTLPLSSWRAAHQADVARPGLLPQSRCGLNGRISRW